MKQYHLNKLSPELGAEIGGIDLSKDFSEEIQSKIYDDLIQYKVLFLGSKILLRNFTLNLQKALVRSKSRTLLILM